MRALFLACNFHTHGLSVLEIAVFDCKLGNVFDSHVDVDADDAVFLIKKYLCVLVCAACADHVAFCVHDEFNGRIDVDCHIVACLFAVVKG